MREEDSMKNWEQSHSHTVKVCDRERQEKVAVARPLCDHTLDQYTIGKSILAHAFQQVGF